MANVTTVRFRSMFAGLRSTRRKNIASKYLRQQIARFSNTDIELVKIDQRVNEYITGNVINRGAMLKVIVNKTAKGVEVKLAEDKWGQKTSAASVTAKKDSKPAAGVIPEKPKQQSKPAQAPAKAEKPKAEQKKEQAPGAQSKPAGVMSEKPKTENKAPAQGGQEKK